MLFSQRRALHKQIALNYEKTNSTSFATLAHHWLHSLDEGVRNFKSGKVITNSKSQGRDVGVHNNDRESTRKR